MTAAEPLDLAAIEARNVNAMERTWEWCKQAAVDRRDLVAEVHRLQAQAERDALNAADDAERIDQLETQMARLQAQEQRIRVAVEGFWNWSATDRATLTRKPEGPTHDAEFLLARVAEDAEVAYGGAPSPWIEGEPETSATGQRQVLDRHGHPTATCYYGGTYGHVLRFDPTRIMAECEAKRRIVDLWELAHREDAMGMDGAAGALFAGRLSIIEAALRALTLPYADHPDYHQDSPTGFGGAS